MRDTHFTVSFVVRKNNLFLILCDQYNVRNIREHLSGLLNRIFCLVQKYHIYVCLESSMLLIVLHPQKHKVNVPIKSLDKSLQKYYILFLFYFLCAPFTFHALVYREILSVFSRDLNLPLQKGVDSIERGSLPLSSAHMWQASSICIFTYIPRLFSLQDAALFFSMSKFGKNWFTFYIQSWYSLRMQNAPL